MEQTQKIQENSITDGVIWKQLLIFFFPILIGTFFQQLYNTVDTIVVGQYVGTNALAAVGTTGTLINLLVGFFVGVSSGATVIISQFFGAGDRENVSKAVHTSMALALVGGLIIMVFGLLTGRPSLAMLGVPEEIMDDALTYLNVYYCGIIACMIYNVGTGVLRAIGDSRMPLYVLIVCCLVNIVLDLLFVLAFHWDVFGVAFATVLSQVVSAALILLRLMLTRESYRVELKKIRFDRSILRNVIRIGLPAGLQSVLYSVSNLVVQASINSFGTDAIASWAAIGKIDGFIWMVMSAFGISVTTFVGQNFGARRYGRVKRSIKVCLGMALGTTIALSVLLLLFMEPLLRFFHRGRGGDRDRPELLFGAGPQLFYLCVYRDPLRRHPGGGGVLPAHAHHLLWGVRPADYLAGAGGVYPRSAHHADGGYELPHHLGDRRGGVHHLLPADELAAPVHQAQRPAHARGAVRGPGEKGSCFFPGSEL